MDCSPPGFSVHGILQTRILNWTELKSLSRVWLFATLWTVAYQAPLSIGFSRQEYWSGLPFPSPRILKVKVKSLSPVQLYAIPWTVAHQASPSIGFYRQESWSGLPFPSAGDLPNPGIKPGSPALQADTLTSEPPGKPKNIEVGSNSLFQGVFLTQG